MTGSRISRRVGQRATSRWLRATGGQEGAGQRAASYEGWERGGAVELQKGRAVGGELFMSELLKCVCVCVIAFFNF